MKQYDDEQAELEVKIEKLQSEVADNKESRLTSSISSL